VIAAELVRLVGPDALVEGSAVAERMAMPPYQCGAGLLVRPSSTDQLSRILKLCHASGQRVVTHGGRSGFAGGCSSEQGDLIISLERMNELAIDPVGRTATASAGVIIEQLQQAARQHDLLFGVDWGGRGSATVGGAISTNAGGNQVLRYGMMREQVLGLEAVLADGTIVSSMSRVLKNNAGYDLKQLFIGSEGTLGIVTRAVLRLRALPKANATAMIALERFDALASLLAKLEGGLDGRLTSYEVMWRSYHEGASEVLPTPLFATPPAYLVLAEASGSDAAELQERFVDLLGEMITGGLVKDALIAKSEGERSGWWAVRDNFRSLARLAPMAVFDVSVPTADVPDYLAQVEQALLRDIGEARMAVFGHLGDQNLHIIVGHGSAPRHAAEAAVYNALEGRGGSMSAEHGVGLAKRHWLHVSRSPSEITLMRQLKACLDPKTILNPGRIL
jgi:FAD/FMN-containing dehydrogenase